MRPLTSQELSEGHSELQRMIGNWWFHNAIRDIPGAYRWLEEIERQAAFLRDKYEGAIQSV